jgi:hypothetical protein
VLLAYIDESYDKVEYWLTALVVPADNALQLQNDLDAVVSDAAKSYGISPDAELHGSHIRAGKGDWAGMKEMIRARIKVYSDALEAIAACDGLELAFRGIDIPKHKARYGSATWHPHRVALDFLCQSLNGIALGKGTHFLAIADEIDQADTLRASYWHFQRLGTLSPYTAKIDRGVDALHFAPSKHSRLLQAADLVSYLNFRMRRSSITNPRARQADAGLAQIVAPKRCVWNLWP